MWLPCSPDLFSGFITVGNSDYFAIGDNDYYTLTGYVKATTAEAAKASYIKLDAYDANNNLIGQVASNRIGEANQWNRLQLTVSKKDFSGTPVKIQAVAVVNSTSGTVYFDNLQLEKNSFSSSYNLLDNTSFEQGLSSPDYWANTPAIPFSWETTDSFSGSKSIKITNPGGRSEYSPSYFVPYESNKPYSFSGFIKALNLSNTSGAYLEIQCYDDSTPKNQLGVIRSNTLPLSPDLVSSDWTHLEAYAAPVQVPSGTVYIKPAIVVSSFTGTVYFDSMRLQEGKISSAYEYNQADGNGKGANNYLSKVTDQLNNIKSFIYDAVGNIKSVTDALSNTTSFEYDNLDRLKTVTLPADIELKTEYSYDGNGNRTQVVNKSKAGAIYNTTSYSFNRYDLLATITDPMNKITTFRYDNGGNLTAIEYPTNKKLGYSYNQANRLTNISFDGTTKYTFGYDANGNRTSVQDNSNSKTWTSIFDKVDRLIKVTNPDNSTQENTFDKNSNRLTQKVTVGANINDISYVYSKTDKLLGLTVNNINKSNFAYDERDNLVQLQSANGTFSNKEYNQLNWLTKLVNTKSNGDILSSYGYTYDQNGNRQTVTNNAGKIITYTYDHANQLLSETDPLSSNIIYYDYDALGNRKTKTVKDAGGNVISTIPYLYNAANQLTSVGGQTYTYDDVGKQDLKDDGSKTYIWDADRRLTEVHKKSDNSLIGQYEYDADGRRLKSTVSGVVTNYHYDGDSIRVLYETDGSGSLTTLYTYSADGLLLSMTKSGQTYYYHYNGHGDVIQITDQSGNIVASYTYDAWGNILSSSGTMAESNPYRYAGYRYDSETGMYYLNSRYYSPSLGRLISRDKFHGLEDDPASLNQYVYCGNNSVNKIDPDGHFGLALAGGGAIGGIGTLVAGEASIGPVGWVALGVTATAILGYNIYMASQEGPINKANRKKQGREVNETKKSNKNWKSKSNKDPNRLTKKHTPGRDHRR